MIIIDILSLLWLSCFPRCRTRPIPPMGHPERGEYSRADLTYLFEHAEKVDVFKHCYRVDRHFLNNRMYLHVAAAERKRR